MKNDSKILVVWLSLFIFLVVIMIGVGGATRLTRSGLSIAEWKPVSGIIPPITQEDWEVQFNLYKQTPEFQKVNAHFEISDYKKIFIWEYLHRLLGRIIFFVALFPGLVFWRQKKVSLGFVLGLSGLVAAQGLVGWIMVKSGLNNEPRVSPFFLALHFFFAVAVMAFAQIKMLILRSIEPVLTSKRLVVSIYLMGGVLGVQILYGCLTSGWRAGFMYNTYPLMGGQFFPLGGLDLEPAALNIIANPAMVQWIHRWLGLATLVTFAMMIRLAWKEPQFDKIRGAFFHLFGMLGVQVGLGIFNILLIVPTALGVAHQVVASFVVLGLIKFIWRVRAATHQDIGLGSI